ncbi:MAG: MMPL family transporter, partial [Planctomycetes bacterium]|nr:MMPL family transporter [Planctomycetota bacterium]
MFALLGRFVTRAWPFLLLGWLLLLGGLWLAAPPWEEAAEESRFTFLPEGSLSRHGEELFRQAFPDEVFGSSIVLVVARPSDSRGLQDPDRTFLEQVLLPALHQIASSSGSQGTSSIVARIRTFTDPGTGALLVSPDHQVTLILVDLKTAIRDRGNGPLIDKIDHLVEQLRRENQTPASLEITLTGSAVLGHDWEREEIRGAQQSQNWTIALVVVLLVLLYRAPLLTLIPLATVFLSVEISLKLLALLASRGLITFFRDIWIYITVLTYGAGVDYCLFLIARYREEWHQGGDFRQALARAIGKVGGALSASAATVMAGIGMMGLARLSEIREAGITIPISLAVVLAGALTFTPALLCLTRQWAFWPQSPVDQATPRRGWLSSRSRL